MLSIFLTQNRRLKQVPSWYDVIFQVAHDLQPLKNPMGLSIMF